MFNDRSPDKSSPDEKLTAVSGERVYKLIVLEKNEERKKKNLHSHSCLPAQLVVSGKLNCKRQLKVYSFQVFLSLKICKSHNIYKRIINRPMIK